MVIHTHKRFLDTMYRFFFRYFYGKVDGFLKNIKSSATSKSNGVLFSRKK